MSLFVVFCVFLVAGLAGEVTTAPFQVSPVLDPFHVYVQGHGTYWCSGTLISRDYVVSNGFCLNGATSATVYLGFQGNPFYEPNRQEANTQTIGSSRIIVHEDFVEIKEYRHLNNIALIRLSSPVVLTQRIQPALLASLTQSQSVFGRTGNLTSWYQQYLTSVLARVSNQDTCEVAYGSDFFTSQEFCGKWLSDRLDATGIPFSINGRVYGQRTGSPCPAEPFVCSESVVILSFARFLEWISRYTNITVQTLTGENPEDINCCLRTEKRQLELIQKIDGLRTVAERIDRRQIRIEEILDRRYPYVYWNSTI